MTTEKSSQFQIKLCFLLIYFLIKILNKFRVKSDSMDIQSTSKTQHEIEIATNTCEDEEKHENDFWKYIDINKVQQEVN